MIKFFRKIRQKMLNENRFSKYMFYAIGEIVLVVIGILIALQINNWNEHKKLRNKELMLLSEMHSNLEDDLSDLRYNVEQNALRIKTNEVIRTAIENKLEYSDSLDSYFGKLFGNFQLSENTAAWENLKSVGLDLISNDSLRNSISYLYANKYKYLENLEKGLDDRYQWNFLYPQVLVHLSIDELWVAGRARDHAALLEDEKFYEVIKMNITVRGYMQSQYEANLELVTQLKDQIKRQLEELKD